MLAKRQRMSHSNHKQAVHINADRPPPSGAQRRKRAWTSEEPGAVPLSPVEASNCVQHALCSAAEEPERPRMNDKPEQPCLVFLDALFLDQNTANDRLCQDTRQFCSGGCMDSASLLAACSKSSDAACTQHREPTLRRRRPLTTQNIHPPPSCVKWPTRATSTVARLRLTASITPSAHLHPLGLIRQAVERLPPLRRQLQVLRHGLLQLIVRGQALL
jgi:hypothetical protein